MELYVIKIRFGRCEHDWDFFFISNFENSADREIKVGNIGSQKIALKLSVLLWLKV